MKDESNPYTRVYYKVEIDDIKAGEFSEVSGSDIMDSIKYTEDDVKVTPLKFPGFRNKSITLKNGIMDAAFLKNWIDTGTAREVQRKTVMVTLAYETGKPAVLWRITNALPVKYNVSFFNNQSSEVELEFLELAHEE